MIEEVALMVKSLPSIRTGWSPVLVNGAAFFGAELCMRVDSVRIIDSLRRCYGATSVRVAELRLARDTPACATGTGRARAKALRQWLSLAPVSLPFNLSSSTTARVDRPAFRSP